MILDQLQNASLYRSLHPRIAQGLKFLQELRIEQFEEQKVSIDGDTVFALFQQLETRPADKAVWETHHVCVDIQYVVSGTERMGVLPVCSLGEPHTDDPSRDVRLYNAPAADVTPTELLVPAGSFAIFFSRDAHAPCLQAVPGKSETVQKIVVKVRL